MTSFSKINDIVLDATISEGTDEVAKNYVRVVISCSNGRKIIVITKEDNIQPVTFSNASEVSIEDCLGVYFVREQNYYFKFKGTAFEGIRGQVNKMWDTYVSDIEPGTKFDGYFYFDDSKLIPEDNSK